MIDSMLAWQAVAYGAPTDCLRLVSIPIPEPGPGEVRIQVAAASLNPIDYKMLNGDLRRLHALSFPVTPGFDASGVVDAVGPGASKFRIGDQVFVRASRDTLGAFAQFCVQPESFVAHAPALSSATGAASLPLVALTTVQGLVDRAHAREGQRILIHAGSGGLGSFAVQYARHLGLHVVATASSRNAARVLAHGAHEVIAYDREDYANAGRVYDIVFDTLGGEHTLKSFHIVKRGGSVVSVAGPPDREMIKKFGRNILVRAVMGWMSRTVQAAARSSGANYFRYLTESNGEQLQAIAALVDAGAVKPVVDRVFEFTDAVAAFEYLMAGHARGKVVLDLDTGLADAQ